jgi:hypothetical protein
MRSKLMFVAAAAVAGVGIWVVEDGRSSQEAAQREIARLRANVDELKGDVRRRPLAPGRTDSTGDVVSLARAEAERAAERLAERSIDERGDEPRAAKRPAMTVEQSQAAVLEAFGEETSDAAWAGEAAGKLGAAIREHLPKGTRLGQIECHTTMCQIELTSSEPGGAQQVVMTAFRDWPGSLFVARDRQERGESVVTIIASREGHEPPLAPR